MPDAILDGNGEQTLGRRPLDGTDLEDSLQSPGRRPCASREQGRGASVWWGAGEGRKTGDRAYHLYQQAPPTRRRQNCGGAPGGAHALPLADRKSTRLTSSHLASSYAVFCLK